MNENDSTRVLAKHRREIRDDGWPRHESDRRILALGFVTVMVGLIVLVTVVAVVWP